MRLEHLPAIGSLSRELDDLQKRLDALRNAKHLEATFRTEADQIMPTCFITQDYPDSQLGDAFRAVRQAVVNYQQLRIDDVKSKLTALGVEI